MNEDPAVVFDEACSILRNHDKVGHDAVDTLNRLFLEHLKHFYSDLAKDAVRLDRSNVEARHETWPMYRILMLQRIHERSIPAGPEDLPLIVVQFRDMNCLIDGASRINKWALEGRISDHDVIVLDVREPPTGT